MVAAFSRLGLDNGGDAVKHCLFFLFLPAEDSCRVCGIVTKGWPMPEAVTNELIYEVLKKLQQSVAKIDTKLDDHTHQFIGLREQLHTIEGNFLRQERLMTTMETRVERIENRLNLNDPQH